VKKLFVIIIAILLVFAFIVSMLPISAGADVGDFNDYDSGGSDWGSSYDSDSSWGWSSSGGDYDGGGGGGGSVLIVVIIVVVLYFVLRNQKKKGGGSAVVTGGPQVVNDHTSIIVPAIQQIDPKFSSDKFIGWAKEVFFTLQYAWMERDWAKVRPFEKEELYKQHEMQLQQYINNGRINVLERININQAFLQKYVRDSDYEYLTVFLQVRMTDYIKDEKTGQVLKGSPNVDSHMKYLYTFMRKNGVLTDPASSNMSTTNCPNCGAPTKITSAGKCEYCDSVIVTGDFDWVLSNIDGVKPQTVIDDRGVIIQDNKGGQ